MHTSTCILMCNACVRVLCMCTCICTQVYTAVDKTIASPVFNEVYKSGSEWTNIKLLCILCCVSWLVLYQLSNHMECSNRAPALHKGITSFGLGTVLLMRLNKWYQDSMEVKMSDASTDPLQHVLYKYVGLVFEYIYKTPCPHPQGEPVHKL